MRLVVVLVPTPGFAHNHAFLLLHTSFYSWASRWSRYVQFVRLVTVDALADVQHAVVVKDMRAPETPLCLALIKVAE